MKHKVGNKAHVEGSIAEKYVYEDLTHFCSMYFESEVETVHNMLGRNMVDDRSRDPGKLVEFTYPVEPLGAYTGYHLDPNFLSIVTHYILTNMQEVSPYIIMFEEEVRSKSQHLLSDTQMDTMMKDNFALWLQNKVHDNNEQLQSLLRGPALYVISYKRCRVNGYSFNLGKSSSGILVKGSCYGDSGSNYYGSLQEILKGRKKDKNGVLLIDLSSKLQGDDVYILASQATQVYYAPSVKNPNSNIHTIITCRPQVLSGRSIDANIEPLQEEISNTTAIDFSSSVVGMMAGRRVVGGRGGSAGGRGRGRGGSDGGRGEPNRSGGRGSGKGDSGGGHGDAEDSTDWESGAEGSSDGEHADADGSAGHGNKGGGSGASRGGRGETDVSQGQGNGRC
ncbi:hypothetical protein DCAR_0101061 [Daucus carota subsp. sativus]|uniref:DUF4218 domain-containing protein n=1 Tax=Daucus carota subsp. sativus TaxID=79200 RepID=A0AAF0W1Z2_DAUCS|nr:PREDICTED: keratin, type II cytoskeletal 1-like [Daucus carota subsp. sativus]WOG81905.1 hypothetical protein DCAR_0101061 [Daucus carota subsp. sativus]